MTRSKLIGVALGVIVMLTLANAGLTLRDFGNVHDTQARQARETRQVRSQQATITALQRTLLASQKASAHTRVTTVAQRCELTRLTAGVLARRDPADVAAFQRSLAGCQAQLQLVKRIDARTPSASPGG